ncbi:hypothetical protein E1301_Tti012978 [Triplophysa tibetana]|uniref:Ig-like domain-containing protein n=1 Tax=Triplophysa tibetana TaxID=1572043 RepID=A0A5A9NTS6_9TELE|nr:hypothetical protein E1301_Tti012978 [Triplophysa tibetana]
MRLFKMILVQDDDNFMLFSMVCPARTSLPTLLHAPAALSLAAVYRCHEVSSPPWNSVPFSTPTGTIIHIFVNVRLFLVFMFIHEVSPQVTVDGVVGGFVVLPCSGSKDQPSIQEINLHWRHNESLNVYDIIKGVESVESQQPEYKNRTAMFSKEYLKGNFSLRLNNLRHTDAGTYSCFIMNLSVIKKVELLISEKSEDRSNHGAQQGAEKIVTVALLSISILLFI